MNEIYIQLCELIKDRPSYIYHINTAHSVNIINKKNILFDCIRELETKIRELETKIDDNSEKIQSLSEKNIVSLKEGV